MLVRWIAAFRQAAAARARSLLVAAIVVLILVAGPGTVSAASPPPTARDAQARPAIVLVHGAWADSSSWAGVTRRLQRVGYTVKVPPNPLRGLAGDAAYIASFLRTLRGPIVLAGHSYGGAVITNAATGNPSVRALVYVDAFIPAEGETVLELLAARPGSQLAGDPRAVFDLVPYPGAVEGDVDLYVKPRVFRRAFANDLPAPTAAVLAATQRPIAFGAASVRSGPPAWRTIPSWSLIGTLDNVIPPSQQRAMSRRADARTTSIRVSHLSLISRPDAVTNVILAAARAAARR